MLDLLSGTESALAAGRLDRQFGNAELLAARGEELGNVIDRVVALERTRGLRLDAAWVPGCTLIFVFIGVVRGLAVIGCGASPRWAGEGAPSPTAPASSPPPPQRNAP